MMTNPVSHYLRSSIGRKHLIAITGLALCGFLVGHLAGNFLLMVGPDAFNMYAHQLVSLGAALYVIEGILGLAFLVHLGLAIKLTLENKAARGNQKYHVKVRTGRGTTIMSQTMPYTGIVLLIFIILHLINLKFGTHYDATTASGVEVRDLYRLTMEFFSSTGNVIWYVFAMICAGMHTAHGVGSAFQSLGLNHPRFYKTIVKISYLYAIVIGGGFAFISIWAHLKGV